MNVLYTRGKTIFYTFSQVITCWKETTIDTKRTYFFTNTFINAAGFEWRLVCLVDLFVKIRVVRNENFIHTISIFRRVVMVVEEKNNHVCNGKIHTTKKRKSMFYVKHFFYWCNLVVRNFAEEIFTLNFYFNPHKLPRAQFSQQELQYSQERRDFLMKFLSNCAFSPKNIFLNQFIFLGILQIE